MSMEKKIKRWENKENSDNITTTATTIVIAIAFWTQTLREYFDFRLKCYTTQQIVCALCVYFMITIHLNDLFFDGKNTIFIRLTPPLICHA